MPKLNSFLEGNKEIIEIVPNDSVLGLLRRSNNQNFKVCLPLFLNIGDLSNIEKFDRKCIQKFFNKICILFENGFIFENEFNRLKNIIKESNKIRIWSSHLDAESYCLLLFICYHFKERNIGVVFSEEYDWKATSFSFISKDEMEEVLKREHILKQNQKEDYFNEWQNIVLENKEFRYIINGEIKSMDFCYLENCLITRLKELGESDLNRFVASLIANPLFPRLFLSPFIYNYLINKLIVSGKIVKIIKENKEYIKVKLTKQT